MRDEFKRGYVQVYTGNGKGKTTAAIGLTVRALGAGFRVFFAQFIKGGRYSEVDMLEKIAATGALVHKQYGKGCFIVREAMEEDRKAAKEGLAEIREAMRSGDFQLIVMDEANVAAKLGLIETADLIGLIDKKPPARRADVKGAALQGGDAFVRELAAAVNQARQFGAVLQGLARNGLVIRFVRLAQIGRVGAGHGAFLAHPQQGGGSVQAAGKGDADFLASGKRLQDGGHVENS